MPTPQSGTRFDCSRRSRLFARERRRALGLRRGHSLAAPHHCRGADQDEQRCLQVLQKTIVHTKHTTKHRPLAGVLFSH